MKIFFGSSISESQQNKFKASEISEFISDSLTIDKFQDGEILPHFRESIRDENLY